MYGTNQSKYRAYPVSPVEFFFCIGLTERSLAATNKNAVHLRRNEFAIIRHCWRRYVNDDEITKTKIVIQTGLMMTLLRGKRKKYISIVFADVDYAFDCKTVVIRICL